MKLGRKFGHIVTEETRQKIREALKSRGPLLKEHRANIGKGVRRNPSSAQFKNGHKTWNKGIPFSEEAKVRMGLSKKGKHFSPRTEFKKGEPGFWLGKKRLSMSGSNNPNWRGGTTTANTKRCGDPKWRRLAKTIYKRDNWCCRICGIYYRDKIICHHIKPVREGGTDELDNLVTLCRAHHLKIERSKFQDFWTQYFKMGIKVSPN